jgi:hypothetical protein
MRNTITLHHAFKSLNLSNSPLPELNFVPRHDNRIYFSIFYGRAHLLRCSVQHNVPVRGHHLVEHLLWEQFESILELHPGMSVVLHLAFSCAKSLKCPADHDIIAPHTQDASIHARSAEIGRHDAE